MNDKLLHLTNIHRTYHLGKAQIPVLRGLNLDVNEGEWLCLLGASGSGKTTLLNLIGCLEKPDKGQIFYRDTDLGRFSKSTRTIFRREKIGFIFQAYHLLPELTVLENVKIFAELGGPRIGAKKRSQEILERVGLGHRMNHRPAELSGGEQQRAAIARSLINNPEIILADEPTGNLDSKTGQGILELFQNLHDFSSKTIVMVTHNQEIANLANKVVRITDGIIQE